ncbi:L-threonylcarbamoyladenylate synthase [Enterococcus sp.]|uniref:L-threonylcarbamoyladenylate synthase n=1 Tax=Enterococcus sp. TaxID=35783 RepID=UPI001FA2304A|nr:threonylcarbamoyl-AMP synthase [Candidatus Enterococcus stercoravium]
MDTKRYHEDEITEAAQLLQAGELVAFPTETVYGLGANALLPEAVMQVFQVKGRPQDNPLIVHVADFQQVKEFVENFHPLTEKIVKNFWPGPLTLIFSIKKDSLAPVVTGGLSTAAFRMPDHELTLELIREAGVPLVGPSANTSGKPSPTTADHVLHDMSGKIAGVLDGGATQIGVESTVLDLSDPSQPPVILRPGAITQETLMAVLETTVEVDGHLVSESETPRAPGMKYKHYAPDTQVLMVHPQDWEQALQWVTESGVRAGVIAGPEIAELMRYQAAAVFMLPQDTVTQAAKGLFAGLRALDEPQLALDVILVETFPETGLGVAYMNRLGKSAGKRWFEAKAD